MGSYMFLYRSTCVVHMLNVLRKLYYELESFNNKNKSLKYFLQIPRQVSWLTLRHAALYVHEPLICWNKNPNLRVVELCREWMIYKSWYLPLYSLPLYTHMSISGISRSDTFSQMSAADLTSNPHLKDVPPILFSLVF